ncbi:MAG: ATP-binding protein, partial [Desulfobacterales bacterium]|nr:ATP-binding protein [Desulfobacterales bacterium]
GRDQPLAHVLQRDPANYLLIGGRQLGKSTLLKEIERRCAGRSDLACRYLVLSDDRIVGRIAVSLDLPPDSPMEAVLSRIRRLSARRRVLFLIDEADKFIEKEEKNDYRTLQLFRGLSEEGQCHFILAGFWELYRVAAFQYHAPIKNFGDVLLLDALEPDACRELVTVPMSHLNIRYESDDLVEKILRETGRRPNLIAIICGELLKKIDPAERVVAGDDLENAIYSEAVQISLAGWGALSEKDEAANRLDRIIVYAMIREKAFGVRDVLQMIEKSDLPYKPEAV